jgi:UPF0716 family protein affecting phage T7 exclusion
MLVVGGLCLMAPGWTMDVVGIALGLVALRTQIRERDNKKASDL